MTDPIELEKRFAIPDHASIAKGQGGLPLLKIETTWSSAEIYLHGAHVARFQKKNQPPLLWLSEHSKFDEHSPIRGGIPVILPWFGPREGAAAHGFARVKPWDLKAVNLTPAGTVRVHLHLPEVADVAGFTPFTADYIVTVGDKLELELVVNNSSGDRDLTVEECLHTYFTVGEIGAVSIAGLKGTKYLDKVAGGVEKTETNDVIKIESEVDRVYMDTTAAVEIHDTDLRRKILVEKEGSTATVVWNPWIAKSKAMADFGDEEFHEMVCVESGNVGKNKITISGGKSAVMKVRLSSAAM